MNTLNLKDQQSTSSVTYTDKEEQYVMGIKYLFGDGVEENPKQGLKLLKQAATQRHLEAQFLLGQLFQAGFKTLQPNKEQAIRWYKLLCCINQELDKGWAERVETQAAF